MYCFVLCVSFAAILGPIANVMSRSHPLSAVSAVQLVDRQSLAPPANGGTVPGDARKLVETATLAGAVIGSGKRFNERRVAVEETIPD